MSDEKNTTIDEVNTDDQKLEETVKGVVEDTSKDDSEYEKLCSICHRPESITGKMIELPNNLYVCPDCMQKSFDMMNNGQIDLNQLMRMPGVQILNMQDLENMMPKQQKVKKKKEKKEEKPERTTESSTRSIISSVMKEDAHSRPTLTLTTAILLDTMHSC